MSAIHVPVTAQAVLRLAVPRAVVPAAVAFAFVAPFVATSVAGPLRDDERGLQLLCPAGPVAKAVSTQMKAAVADASTLLQCCKFDVSLPVGEAKAKEIVAALKEYTPKAEVKKLWRKQRTDAAKAMAELERHIASICASESDRDTESCDPSIETTDRTAATLPYVAGKRRRCSDSTSCEVKLSVNTSRCLDTIETSVNVSGGNKFTFSCFGRDDLMPLGAAEIAAIIECTTLAELMSDKGAAALFIAWGSTMACGNGRYNFSQHAADIVRKGLAAK